MRRLPVILWISLLLCHAYATSIAAGQFGADDIPEPLRPWMQWVLYGHEEEMKCPPLYDNSKKRECAWPTEMELSLDETSGGFIQKWTVHVDQYVSLPGGAEHWPSGVTVDGSPVPVTMRGGEPSVHLTAGGHVIAGTFSWSVMPERLAVPKRTAMVRLIVAGQTVPHPVMDGEGRIWLRQETKKEEKEEDRLYLKVFRLIDDQIPPRIVTRMELDVAGAVRETILPDPFPPGAGDIPVSLEGQVPARVEPNGEIRAQVRPGRHMIVLTSRAKAPLLSLSLPSLPAPWPAEEIWSFQAHSELRIVEIEGVSAIDPQQTTLPHEWRALPAYHLKQGETMKFVEIKRGDPTPPPDQLILQRDIWLRFDGSGCTIRDTITGTKSSGWRLEAQPPIQLGRVVVDGADQFITRRQGSPLSGVELRHGVVNLTAESRLEGFPRQFAATGWDHDFQKAEARIHLPPGWRLLAASGPDFVGRSWVKQWTLLDIFLVLVISLAARKLWGNLLGLLALVTLALTYHEPGAPRWVWPNILIATALVRAVPEGRGHRLFQMYRLAALLSLVAIALPFMVQQARQGIYPQLERPWQTVWSDSAPQRVGLHREDVRMKAERMADGEAFEADAPLPPEEYEYKMKMRAASLLKEPAAPLSQYDPGAMIQTGPGLPDWRWDSVTLGWSGPVDRTQQVGLMLTGPSVNMALSFGRVLLLGLLGLGVIGVFTRKGRGGGWTKWGAALPLVAFMCLFPFAGRATAAEFPPAEMLETLRLRLLEPHDCFPRCAESGLLEVTVTPEELSFSMEFDAHVESAVPLPGSFSQWSPKSVLIDGKASVLVRSEDGTLWTLLPSGRHRLVLRGLLPERRSVQVGLPLKPRRVGVVSAEGWNVEGVREDGSTDGQLQFVRIVRPEEERTAERKIEAGPLPPFLVVERTLRLGLKWQVITEIRRTSPPGSPVVISVPLLPGESVTTDGIRTEGGKVLVSMDRDDVTFGWQSSLEPVEHFLLEHAATDAWTELWRVDVSPVWHMEYEGIPVIFHQEGGRWHPTWHPWPGEKVQFRVTRPEGVEGRSLTIDRSHLEIRPGRRATDVTLSMVLRSSQGGQHAIHLPDGAELRAVAINEKPQPIRQEGVLVTLPLVPGEQRFRMEWQEPRGMGATFRTSVPDLRVGSVNASVDIFMPNDRWTLFVGGPRLGPAVLFWGVMLVILLAAIGLGRLKLTPLGFPGWFFLGIGMSQAPLAGVLVVVAWLLVLGLRRGLDPEKMDGRAFNAMQSGIFFLTVATILSLIYAISMGLLGVPEMQITGNGSTAGLLRWYQDSAGPGLPAAWVISVPMFIYRLAMLAWSLWISFTLLSLLRWGWECYTHGSMWRQVTWLRRVSARSQAGTNGAKKEKPPEDARSEAVQSD